MIENKNSLQLSLFLDLKRFLQQSKSGHRFAFGNILILEIATYFICFSRIIICISPNKWLKFIHIGKKLK